MIEETKEKLVWREGRVGFFYLLTLSIKGKGFYITTLKVLDSGSWPGMTQPSIPNRFFGKIEE